MILREVAPLWAAGRHRRLVLQGLRRMLVRRCSGTDAHAAVILLGDAAGGTAVVAAIRMGDAPSDMGSPLHRAEDGPVLSAAADGVGALRQCFCTQLRGLTTEKKASVAMRQEGHRAM